MDYSYLAVLILLGLVVIWLLARAERAVRRRRASRWQFPQTGGEIRTTQSTYAPGQLQLPKATAPAGTPIRLSPSSPSVPHSPRATPQTRVLNLDAAQFSPITDQRAKSLASSAGNLWGNPWFGRRDLIPPASDPRTQLIDRAMVGQGLLTPEELVEIHEVGDEMARLRPAIAGAHAAAEQAVREDAAERQRRKEQKKAEAAERKRKHAEAVAHRRQTDIVFLGRGVSRGLADRRANVEKLTAAGLPVLATPQDVATALGLTIPRLRWLAFHSEASPVTHYVRFTVPKRSGGQRALFAPHEQMTAAQEWILANILEKVPAHAAAHGFVAGRSTVTNATAHVSREVVINADLTDFFPTITFDRVRGVLQHLGYSPAAATILALICTESPRRPVKYAGKLFHVATGPRGLPQGACTSPALSNLVARRLDSRLTGIAAKLGWTYTRYADDLTFSASGAAAGKIGYLLARVRHIAADEGFAVNEKKTRVLRQSTAQNVTGIIVNERPGVPRELVRRMRAILHRAKTEGLASQNRGGHPNFELWVRGMIAYIEMVNPRQAAPLRAQFEAVRPA